MSHIFAVSSAFFMLFSLIDPEFNLRSNEPKTIIFCPQAQKFHDLLLLTTCPIWGLFPRPLWMHFFTFLMLFAFLITHYQGLQLYQNTEGSIHRKKCDTSISWALLSQLPQNFPSLSWTCFLAVQCAVFFDRCVLTSGMSVPEGIEFRAQGHMLHLHQLGFGTFPRVKRPSGRVSNTSWAHSMWN